MTLHVSRIPSLLSFFFFFPLFPSPSSNVRYSSRSRGRQRSYFSPGRPFSRWNPREINVKFQSRRCVETWHLLNDYLHWTQKTLFILDTSNVSEGREALRKWWWPGMRSNPTPVSMCRVSTREITRDIFARKIFPPSRSRLVPKRRSRSRQSYRGPRRMHIRDLLPLSPS